MAAPTPGPIPQQIGSPLAQASLLGNAARYGLSVTGEHDDARDASGAQLSGELRGLNALLISESEHGDIGQTALALGEGDRLSTFMSRGRRRSAEAAARATGQPPTAIDNRYKGSATRHGADTSDAITATSSRSTDRLVDAARASRRQNGAPESGAARSAGRAR